MSSKKIAATGALVAGSGLVATTFALVPSAAFAATDCGTGTEVSNGVCEMVYNAAGDYTFTVPAGVSKIAAVLVGGGGGALYNAYTESYGGGGGEVVFVDNLATSGTYAITVGAGGAATDGGQNSPVYGEDGGDTHLDSYTAIAGSGAWLDFSLPVVWGGGNSGNGNLGSSSGYTGAGGGAGGAAPDCYTGANASSCPAGVGETASTVAGDPELFWPVLGENEYGVGGQGVPGLAPGSVGTHAAGHGGDALTDTTGDDGNDGAVIIRWKAALPDTGLSARMTGIVAGAGAVMLAVSLTLLFMRNRLPVVSVNSRVKRALRDIDQRLRRLGS